LLTVAYTLKQTHNYPCSGIKSCLVCGIPALAENMSYSD